MPRRLTADPKQLSLVAAIMGSFVAVLDSTVVNVALPAIGDDLGGGLAGQQWVSNGYLLALGSLILIGGSLGDLFGARRIFALGVGGFGVMSVLCAASPAIGVLVAGRILQGVFGALLTPSALAVIVAVFPEDERGAAIGSWTAWSGIATVFGPLAGGWLVDAVSWRWIFAVNVPFVVATLALVFAAIPRRPPATAPVHVDWLGGGLCVLGLAGPVLGLIRQPTLGWASAGVLAPMLVGLALLAAFLVHEARTEHPMLPLGLFRRRNFAAGNAETLAMYGGLGSAFFFLVLYLQQVAGYDALQAGVATLPTTIVMFLLSRRAGRLGARYGPRAFMGFGPIVAAGGLALLARMGPSPGYAADVLPGLLVFSLGLAATVAPLTTAVLADADERTAGIASGVNNAIARVASLLAISALGAVAAASFASSVDGRTGDRRLSDAGRSAVRAAERRTFARADVDAVPSGERATVTSAVSGASVHAFRVGMGLSAGLVLVGGALGLAGIRNADRRSEPPAHADTISA